MRTSYLATVLALWAFATSSCGPRAHLPEDPTPPKGDDSARDATSTGASPDSLTVPGNVDAAAGGSTDAPSSPGTGPAPISGSGDNRDAASGGSTQPDAPAPDAPSMPDPCAGLPPGACCRDTDCPTMNGKQGKCDSSNHSCQYSCAGTTLPCGTSCIPAGGCCTDAQCSGNHACVANVCSTTACRSGFDTCGNDCITKGTCCRANGCCANSDCGMCEKCTGGRCVPQANKEDLKNECGTGTCQTGLCDGHGGCGQTPDGQAGPGCNGQAMCQGSMAASSAIPAQTCRGGTCQQGQPKDCGHFGCANGKCNTGCPSGFTDTPSGCVACGSPGQQCCPGIARENSCNKGSWCCDVRQKGCDEFPFTLGNTCISLVPQGGDCNPLRNDQCTSGTKCEFDIDACCLPCGPGTECDQGGVCKKSFGTPCTFDSECVSNTVCRVDPNDPTRTVCVNAQ